MGGGSLVLSGVGESSRRLGDFELCSRVCVDVLGETWAGYVSAGPERGRMILVTVIDRALAGLAARPMIMAAEDSVHLRHPHVLAGLGVAEDDKQVAVACEYLEGEPLGNLLRMACAQQAPFSPGVALRIVREVAGGLADLNRRAPGTVPFGGLSPESVFLASFGEAMLRNPAVVATAMRGQAFRSQLSALPYRAPEQHDDRHRLDESCDVYSLGAMCWEMLSGRSLVAGAPGTCETNERWAAQVGAPSGPISEIRSLRDIARPGGAIAPDVLRLVEQMVHQEPALRPQTLLDVVALIDDLPEGLLADPVEVAGTVERLAGRALTRRRATMQAEAPLELFGSRPPSEQVTSRPESGAHKTLRIPRRSDSAPLRRLMGAQDAPAPEPPLDLVTIEGARRGRPSSTPTFPSEEATTARTMAPQSAPPPDMGGRVEAEAQTIPEWAPESGPESVSAFSRGASPDKDPARGMRGWSLLAVAGVLGLLGSALVWSATSEPDADAIAEAPGGQEVKPSAVVAPASSAAREIAARQPGGALLDLDHVDDDSELPADLDGGQTETERGENDEDPHPSEVESNPARRPTVEKDEGSTAAKHDGSPSERGVVSHSEAGAFRPSGI